MEEVKNGKKELKKKDCCIRVESSSSSASFSSARAQHKVDDFNSNSTRETVCKLELDSFISFWQAVACGGVLGNATCQGSCHKCYGSFTRKKKTA
ncbi:hypothetical protein EJ110_NYTH14453 [Nymphaea thermarum]|nr:hypothetical protein EJ110_NYTH14453 [Nymphaea thermarum]